MADISKRIPNCLRPVKTLFGRSIHLRSEKNCSTHAGNKRAGFFVRGQGPLSSGQAAVRWKGSVVFGEINNLPALVAGLEDGAMVRLIVKRKYNMNPLDFPHSILHEAIAENGRHCILYKVDIEGQSRHYLFCLSPSTGDRWYASVPPNCTTVESAFARSHVDLPFYWNR